MQGGKHKGNNDSLRERDLRSLEKGLNASLHEFVRIGRKEGRLKPNIDTDIHPSLSLSHPSQ